jgi:DNA invertase Pin-like site-specific DNA recombinase
MKVALYARTSAAGLDPAAAGEILANLTAYAVRKGWEITLASTDHDTGSERTRKGLRRLREAVRANAVQAVLVGTLSHLATSLRHLTNLGRLLADRGIVLIALEDGLDTTDLAQAIRWHDWLETSVRLDRQLRAEAARLARLRSEPWGHPVVAVNPMELLAHWEGRRGRRPLSLREIARKLGISEATVRRHLHELRATGKVDDQARARALAARGGLRRGGRPANRLDDADLTTAWEAQRLTARRSGKEPSISALARHLHVSRSRVRSRLQDLGLLAAKPFFGYQIGLKVAQKDH